MSQTDAQPLSRVLLGTGTFIYRDGATVTMDLFQWDARRALAKLRGEEGPDEIDWDAPAFFGFERERVEHFEWTKVPEFGWPTKPEARERQRAQGHTHGFLATLVDIWRGIGEPEFSLQALSMLSGIAEEVGRERFEANARLFEGEVGAWYAAHLIRQAEGGPVVGRPEDPVDAAEFDARIVRYARRMRELDREEAERREGDANDVVERVLREEKAAREQADEANHDASPDLPDEAAPSEPSGGEGAERDPDWAAAREAVDEMIGDLPGGGIPAEAREWAKRSQAREGEPADQASEDGGAEEAAEDEE